MDTLKRKASLLARFVGPYVAITMPSKSAVAERLVIALSALIFLLPPMGATTRAVNFQAHMEFVTGVIGTVIASGIASGEFHVPDAGAAAMCTCAAMVRFFHPQLIAESAGKPGPTLDQMIDFVIAGLRGSYPTH